MESNEAFKASNRIAADEEGGDGGGGDGGDLVFVELDDGGVYADGEEEVLHDVAHAARWTAENHHWILRYEPLDPDLCRLRDVDC